MFHLKVWEEKGETQPRRTASRCHPSPCDSYTDQPVPRAMLFDACFQPLPLSGVSSTESSCEFLSYSLHPGEVFSDSLQEKFNEITRFPWESKWTRGKAGGFSFRGQEENSYKPVILESKVETQRLSKCWGSTAQLELQHSHQERHLTTDTRVFPQQGEQAMVLPGFLSLIWF